MTQAAMEGCQRQVPCKDGTPLQACPALVECFFDAYEVCRSLGRGDQVADRGLPGECDVATWINDPPITHSGTQCARWASLHLVTLRPRCTSAPRLLMPHIGRCTVWMPRRVPSAAGPQCTSRLPGLTTSPSWANGPRALSLFRRCSRKTLSRRCVRASLTHEPTNSRTHSRTHAHTHSLSLPLSPSLFLSVARSLAPSPSLSLSSPCLSLSFRVSPCLSLPSLSFSHSVCLSHALIHSLTHSLSLSFTLSLSFPRAPADSCHPPCSFFVVGCARNNVPAHVCPSAACRCHIG